MIALAALFGMIVGVIGVTLAYRLVRTREVMTRPVPLGECGLCRHGMYGDEHLMHFRDGIVHADCADAELNNTDPNRTNHQEP